MLVINTEKKQKVFELRFFFFKFLTNIRLYQMIIYNFQLLNRHCKEYVMSCKDKESGGLKNWKY